jgi:non-specific serine/threonine protein kinase
VPAPRPEATRALHRFEDVEFDEREGLLRLAGQVVDVEPRPLRVLAELLLRVNEVVTKDELMESVWDGRPTVEHVLANAVSKLRAALGTAGAARIVTVPRIGYRLQGPVQRTASARPQCEPAAGDAVPGRSGYLLERALGEAARAEVWLARHATLGHERVFKFASDAAGLSALKREYTLYRVLHKELGPREDFARVVDAQFLSAPYFIECEFGGPSLLEWADADGRLAALPTPERLAVFVQVVAAVAAAHSVGVLHKDLKPGNVLVAGAPGRWQVRLTDFGSGQLLQPQRLAQLKLTALGMTQAQDATQGGHRGTFMYLAPELLAGHAPTVQSDVYSLGVLLWQMVAAELRQPLTSGWQRGIEDPLLVEEITRATDGQPTSRTPSAASMLDHLLRLEQRRAQRDAREAAAAEATAAVADLQRRRARKPWLVAGVGGLAAGLVLSTVMYFRADRERERAVAAQAQVQLVGDFLHRDVLQASDILTMGTRSRSKSLLEVLRNAAEQAETRFADQPLALATLQRRLGETFLKSGSLLDAEHALNRAAELLSPRVVPQDPELLRVRLLRARLFYWQERSDQGARELAAVDAAAGAALAAQESELGYLATRARFASHKPGVPHPELQPLARRLIHLTDRLPSFGLTERADARHRLLEAMVWDGQTERAGPVLEELKNPPFNIKSAEGEFRGRIALGHGAMRSAEGRHEESEREFLAARRWFSMVEDDQNEFAMAWADLELGSEYLKVGRLAKALEALQSARELFVKAVGPEHQYVVVATARMAWALLYSSRPQESLRTFDAAATSFRRIPKANGSGVGLEFGRALALGALGRWRESLDILDPLDAAILQRAVAWKDVLHRHAFARGRARAALGLPADGLAQMRGAVAAMERDSEPWLLAEYRRQLSSAERSAMQTGQLARGRLTPP